VRNFDRQVAGLAGEGTLAALAFLATREPVVFLALSTAKAVARLAEQALVYVGPVNSLW
jgi:hypothetical protein